METEEKRSSASIVFRGMYILGSSANVVDEESAMLAPMVLMGKYDKELKYFLYWRETKTCPQTEEQAGTPVILEMLERAKGYIRWRLQSLIDREQDQYHREREQNFKNMVSEMRDSSKPHPFGTVAQLATRFNVSKSEVRRMRTAGILDKFISEKIGIENVQ